MAYTTIDDPSAYFQTLLYTGNGGASRALTNTGNSDLQPDWLWIKKRNADRSHTLTDSSRGLTKYNEADDSGAEGTFTDKVISAQSDGFTVGDNSSVNANNDTYVAWQWKANGGTTASNTDGTITSTVQANTTAGFSIVTYTGNGTNGAYVGHGLGATPDIVIIKNRSAVKEWRVGFTAFSNDLVLNDTSAGAAYSDGRIGDLLSDKFELGGTSTYGSTNTSGENYVAYVFKSIQGYSKIGTFKGNGVAGGPFIYTGFKPAWLLVKRSSSTGDWLLWDNKRDTFNVTDGVLKPNSSAAENTGYWNIDFLSNGFKIRATDAEINQNGGTFIYMAFAEHPFVSSKGVPTTAR